MKATTLTVVQLLFVPALFYISRK